MKCSPPGLRYSCFIWTPRRKRPCTSAVHVTRCHPVQPSLATCGCNRMISSGSASRRAPAPAYSSSAGVARISRVISLWCGTSSESEASKVRDCDDHGPCSGEGSASETDHDIGNRQPSDTVSLPSDPTVLAVKQVRTGRHGQPPLARFPHTPPSRASCYLLAREPPEWAAFGSSAQPTLVSVGVSGVWLVWPGSKSSRGVNGVDTRLSSSWLYLRCGEVVRQHWEGIRSDPLDVEAEKKKWRPSSPPAALPRRRTRDVVSC
jgi:hypothetical protein